MEGSLYGYHSADAAAAQYGNIPAYGEELRGTQEAVAVGVVTCQPAVHIAYAVYRVIALSALGKLVHKGNDCLLVGDSHIQTAEAFKDFSAVCDILGSDIYEFV